MARVELGPAGSMMPVEEIEVGTLAVGVLVELAHRRGCQNITAHTPHGMYRIAVTLISGKGEARHVDDVRAAPPRR